MARYIEGETRLQRLLLPDCLEDYVSEDNPVRVVDVFIDELDLGTMGFAGPASTGRPGYHPATLLKLYLYGYLNQVQSSRRLEREAGRNVEVMWLTGKLAPDFKTIADFRRDNGAAIRAACAQFVVLCRQLGLLAGGTVAVDGSRFKAVNTRDKNFTPGAIRRRMEQVEASIARYLSLLDTADRQEDDVAQMRSIRLKDQILCRERSAYHGALRLLEWPDRRGHATSATEVLEGRSRPAQHVHAAPQPCPCRRPLEFSR
ncbi:mobile element protein [Bosea sp. BIWAKO-01]|nr:mobile element protein [Bosea sp. BIWAKO-01]